MSCNDKCDIWPFLLLNQSGKGKKKASGFLEDLLQYQMVSQLLGCSTDSSCSLFPCSTPCGPHSEAIERLQNDLTDLGVGGNDADKKKLAAAIKALGGTPQMPK
eukprot:jgi/Bigna1/129899/aug1.10_g4607